MCVCVLLSCIILHVVVCNCSNSSLIVMLWYFSTSYTITTTNSNSTCNSSTIVFAPLTILRLVFTMIVFLLWYCCYTAIYMHIGIKYNLTQNTA